MLNVPGHVMGVVVDSLVDVFPVGADSIKPAPRLANPVDAGYIIGMGCISTGDVDRRLILTDIDALMSSSEMGLMDAAVQ